MLKLGKLSKILNKLFYKDRLDVYRHTVVRNSENSFKNEQQSIAVYTQIPCRISNNYKDLPEEDSFMINPTNQHISIFCGPDYDIKKGDRIIAHRMDDNGKVLEIIDSIAGKPNREINHQEICLVDRDYA